MCFLPIHLLSAVRASIFLTSPRSFSPPWLNLAIPFYRFRRRCRSIPSTAIGSVLNYRITQLHSDGVHCRESAGTRPVVVKVSLNMEMSRLARDGTSEPVWRDQILRHVVRGHRGILIIPVQLTMSRIGNLTRLIHSLLPGICYDRTYTHKFRKPDGSMFVRPFNPTPIIGTVDVQTTIQTVQEAWNLMVRAPENVSNEKYQMV